MKITLDGPVGDLSRSTRNGNFPKDVKAVKQALINLELAPGLSPGTNASANLNAAIRRFQKLFSPKTDGRIDPAPGRTLQHLNRLVSGKSIVVNLRRQVLSAFSGLVKSHFFDCVAGDSKHPTPPGFYSIYRKHERYRSKKYDAQMDYAMFFYRGYAIHMAYFVGVSSYLKWAGIDYLGSHGCVRLSESDAKALFRWAPMKASVVVLPKTQ